MHHQDYLPRADCHDRLEFLTPDCLPEFDSDDYQQILSAAGRQYREAGVRLILLLHGTFVGNDALGFLRKVGRFSPQLGTKLRRWNKQMIESLVGDHGNYSHEYAERFSQGINRGGGRKIEVRCFQWSSENHHIGRADGAIRLIDELLRERPFDGRILCWGHSHGGNLLALVTNLLGASAMRDQFFRAARSYYRWPLLGRVDLPVWDDVRRQLIKPGNPLDELALDIVTFGTPVRYGWQRQGYDKLLHVIHHRPTVGRPDFACAFPPSLEDLLTARGGDYVQQFGIAGTNIGPGLIAWRAYLADLRLKKIVQPHVRSRDLLKHLEAEVRVPDCGKTLLVDYGSPTEHIGRHMAGHAVYTYTEWLPFHALAVANHFYSPPS